MDKRLIAEAIEFLELLDIHVYSSSLKRFEEIYLDNYPDDMAQQNKLSVKAEVLEPEDKEDDSRVINAKVNFGLKFIVGSEKSEQTNLAEIEACFIAKYHQRSQLSEEAIREFLKFNVVHNVWPFWREFAFNTAAKAKLPTPMISLFKPSQEDA